MSNASDRSPSTVVSDMMKSDAYRNTQRTFYTQELADLAAQLEGCKPRSTVPPKGTSSPTKKATTPAPKKAPTPAKAPKPAEEGSGSRVRRTTVVKRNVKKKSFGDKIHDWFQEKSDQFEEWKKAREAKRKKRKYENDMYHTLDEEEDLYDFEEDEEEKHKTLYKILYVVVGILVVILIIVVIRAIFS